MGSLARPMTGSGADGPKRMESETRQWLARHREGDPDALPRLLEMHYARVERIVRIRLGRSLRDRVEVADVVQATMLTALQKLEQYETRDDARLRDWLARIAENHIRNLSRSKREGSLDAHGESLGSPTRWHPAATETSASQRLARTELKETVDACLSDLSEPHREVILWRDYHGASWERIVEELRCPTREAAYQLYQRARSNLREKVVRVLKEPEGPA